MTSNTDRIATLLLILLFSLWAFLFIFHSSVFDNGGGRYFCLFDDAMISLRYAWNFANGDGLVWNQGERVEGFTNPLMVFLMAIPALVLGKSLTVFFVQFMGIPTLLLTGFFCGRILKENLLQENSMKVCSEKPGFMKHVPYNFLGFSVALAYYPLAFWTLSGMETGLITLFLTAAVFLAGRCSTVSNGGGIAYCTGACLGLGWLTRPDFAIFVPLVLAYLMYSGKMREGGRKDRMMGIAKVVFAFLPFFLGLMIFRASYYGEFFPNTYFLKMSGFPLSARVENGLAYMWYWGQTDLPFLVILFISLAGPWSAGKTLLLSILAVASGYQVYVGGDAFVLWRMLCPAVPFVLLIFSGNLFAFLGRVLRSSDSRISPRMGSFLFMAMWLLVLSVLNFPYRNEVLQRSKPFCWEYNQQNVRLGLFIDLFTRPETSVGVTWAGALPYYSGRAGVDFLGKCDKHIARLDPDFRMPPTSLGIPYLPGHCKYDLDYSIKDLQPDFIQAFAWGNQNLREWVKSRYVLIRFHEQQLFIRKDSILPEFKHIFSPGPF